MESNTLELIVIFVLLGLLIGQQGFYMWQTHKLLNKLMSRNYAEFAQVSRPAPDMMGMRVESPDIEDVEDLRALQDMIRPF
jgi:hypothetical protein